MKFISSGMLFAIASMVLMGVSTFVYKNSILALGLCRHWLGDSGGGTIGARPAVGVRWEAFNFLSICDECHSNIFSFKLTYSASVFG